MEGPRHDINELLTRGFFTTASGKGQAPLRSARSYFESHHGPQHERSRSRAGRRRAPPPTVEDEGASLARESTATSTPVSYDPPFRGPIDQVPIILDVQPAPGGAQAPNVQPADRKDENPERRFVLIAQSGVNSPQPGDEGRQRPTNRHNFSSKGQAVRGETLGGGKEDTISQPPRQRSRQDLPSLETKLPREIPPQYRRSASETPRAHAPLPRTTAGEPFLSPNVSAGKRDYFSSSAPRYQPESFGGRTTATESDGRPNSRSGTPSLEKRHSGGVDALTRSRRNTNEKLTRPQQLAEEYAPRRSEQRISGYPERRTASHTSRSSHHSNRRYSSSSDDIGDSDSDQDREHRNRDFRGHGTLDPDEQHGHPQQRSNVYPNNKKPTSRFASPLPSPKVSPSQMPRADQSERGEPFPGERIDSPKPPSPFSPSQGRSRVDRLNAADVPSKLQQRSRSTANPQAARQESHPGAPLPIPIPTPSKINVHSLAESPNPPPYPLDENSLVEMPRIPDPYWQPFPFQPPTPNLDRPIGSYRRYSEDISKGSVLELPTCPRMEYTRDCSDWLTLPNCPSFDICPSCFDSIFAPTEFCDFFVLAPPRLTNIKVVCDFGSSPWYRIAWLLTLKEQRRDLKLFYGLANIAANGQPCTGKQEVIRSWYSIISPKTGSPIRNFNVCDSCVKGVETLLPIIRGTFIRKDYHGSSRSPRICDLRFDSKRFVQYFDTLEVTADHANQYDKDPDMRDFASLAKRFSSMDECERDRDLVNSVWHVITQLPEFTVCEECFDEVVWPELEERKSIPLLFNKSLARLPRASCQLYSPRMRGIFRTAVDADDYKLLASKARERKTIELAYKANVAELKRQLEFNPAPVQKELKKVEEEWRRWE